MGANLIRWWEVGRTMTLKQAQELAARMQREMVGIATTVQSDVLPDGDYSGTFHITVTKPRVIQMCIYTAAQWDDRKHLIAKWESHTPEEGKH